MKKVILFGVATLVCGSAFAASSLQPAYDVLRAKGYHDVYRMVNQTQSCPEVDFNAAKFVAINPQGHIEDGKVCNGQVYETKSTSTEGVLVIK